MNPYKQIYKEIKKNSSILITTHLRADGDCVGSAIGLKEMIKEMFPNKTVKATYDYLSYLDYLPKADQVTDEDFNNSLVISVDNASKTRANDERLNNVPEERIIKIDHHPNREPFGYINFVDEEKCACAEIIFDMFLKFPGARTNKIGIEALYTGIVTDSGRFKYSSVTGATMQKVGMMYDMGLDFQRILNKLDEVSLEELVFKGYVLEHLEKTEHGVLYIKLNKEIRDKYNVTYDIASNMVNSFSNVVGSPIWVLFNEYKEGEIRCRVRSLDIAINEVAEKFGGGGHKNASGIVVKDYETVDNILNELDKLLINED